jgi:hypothetical protein
VEGDCIVQTSAGDRAKLQDAYVRDVRSILGRVCRFREGRHLGVKVARRNSDWAAKQVGLPAEETSKPIQRAR